MKISNYFFSLFFLLLLVSCKKENIYYYSNNVPIKDSGVIHFVNTELENLKISPKEKGLKVYTTLDSVSYKSNFDSIRTKLYNHSIQNKYINKNRNLFDKWFREKVIVINNHTGKIIHYYNTYNINSDRNQIPLFGIRNLLKVGSFITQNSNSIFDENYLYTRFGGSASLTKKDLQINNSENNFLSKFRIKNLQNQNYIDDEVLYTDIIKIIQTINNNGILLEPTCINNVVYNSKTVYQNRYTKEKIIDDISNSKIKKLLNYNLKNRIEIFSDINNSDSIKSIYFISKTTSSFVIIYENDYSFAFVTEGAIPDENMKFKTIPYELLKKTNIKYFNAIKN